MKRKKYATKEAVKYRTISLEEQLLNKINKHIEKNDDYRTVTDFVRVAIRGKLVRDYKRKDGDIDSLTKKYIKQEIEMALSLLKKNKENKM